MFSLPTVFDITYEEQVYGFTGGTVLLPCTLRCEPSQVGSVSPTGEWFMKSASSYYPHDVSISSLSSTNRFTFNKTRMNTNCSLTITNLTKTDTRTYYFKLNEPRQQSWESGIRVEVYDPPTSQFEPVDPLVGKNVSFSCTVQDPFNLSLSARCSRIGTKKVEGFHEEQTTVSLVFTASASHNGASCYCDVEYGGKTITSATRTLHAQDKRTKLLTWFGISFGVIFLLLLKAGGIFFWKKQKDKKTNERGTSSANHQNVSSLNEENQLSNNVTPVYSNLSPVSEMELHRFDCNVPAENSIYANIQSQKKALLPTGNAASGSGIGSSYNRNTTPAQEGPTTTYVSANPPKTKQPQECIYSCVEMPVVKMPSSSPDEGVKASSENHIYSEVNKKCNHFNLKVISAFGKKDVNPGQSQASNASAAAEATPIYAKVSPVKKGQGGVHHGVEKNVYDVPRPVWPVGQLNNLSNNLNDNMVRQHTDETPPQQTQSQGHAGSSRDHGIVYADINFKNT
uniref:Ig-like domain-containing protein n=1 Tax=Eptatretus burgeri TaxID=7764 RepID=A0A8C4QPM7_EPTBU